MKKDILLLFIGAAIASIFFYMKDTPSETPVLNSIIQKSEERDIINIQSTKSDSVKQEDAPNSIENNEDTIVKTKHDIVEDNSSYFTIDDGFKFKPITVGSIKDFDIAFEEQEIDYDWKLAVENEILLNFTDSLHKKSAWIESYECKYSLCRVEIKQTERLVGEEKIDDYIWDEIRTLNEVTNTMGMNIPEHSKDKNGYVFFLMRKEVQLDNNS